MTDNEWKNEIVSALSDIGAELYYQYPATEPEFPCVTYSRIQQSPDVLTDDGTYAITVEIKLDVWDADPDNAEVIANDVSVSLSAAGYHETFRCDLYEQGASPLHHVSMRFSKIY